MTGLGVESSDSYVVEASPEFRIECFFIVGVVAFLLTVIHFLIRRSNKRMS